MNVLEFSSESASDLVGRRQKTVPTSFNGHPITEYLFITISPSAKTMHKTRVKTDKRTISVNVPYGKLKQDEQYNYCIQLVKTCYMEFISPEAELVGTAELNKEGNIHFHLLIHDKKNTSLSRLQVFRRDILNCFEVIKNMSKKSKMVDYMNNIVIVNDSVKDRLFYLDKDYELNKDLFYTFYKFN